MSENKPDITEVIANEALADDTDIGSLDLGPAPKAEDYEGQVDDERTIVDSTLKLGADMPVDEDVLDMAIVRDKVRRDGPYTVRDFNVFDNRGRRVAMAGTDQNRRVSGPLFATAIAAALNKMAGY